MISVAGTWWYLACIILSSNLHVHFHTNIILDYGAAVSILLSCYLSCEIIPNVPVSLPHLFIFLVAVSVLNPLCSAKVVMGCSFSCTQHRPAFTKTRCSLSSLTPSVPRSPALPLPFTLRRCHSLSLPSSPHLLLPSLRFLQLPQTHGFAALTSWIFALQMCTGPPMQSLFFKEVRQWCKVGLISESIPTLTRRRFSSSRSRVLLWFFISLCPFLMYLLNHRTYLIRVLGSCNLLYVFTNIFYR